MSKMRTEKEGGRERGGQKQMQRPIHLGLEKDRSAL